MNNLQAGRIILFLIFIGFLAACSSGNESEEIQRLKAEKAQLESRFEKEKTELLRKINRLERENGELKYIKEKGESHYAEKNLK